MRARSINCNILLLLLFIAFLYCTFYLFTMKGIRCIARNWGPLHTRDWEPMTTTLQALSLVEKAETVQVRFQHYAWGTNGVFECEMDIKSTWISTWYQMDFVLWSLGLFSQNHFFGGRPNIRPRRSWHSECSQPLVYSILSRTETCMIRNSLK